MRAVVAFAWTAASLACRFECSQSEFSDEFAARHPRITSEQSSYDGSEVDRLDRPLDNGVLSYIRSKRHHSRGT